MKAIWYGIPVAPYGDLPYKPIYLFFRDSAGEDEIRSITKMAHEANCQMHHVPVAQNTTYAVNLVLDGFHTAGCLIDGDSLLGEQHEPRYSLCTYAHDRDLVVSQSPMTELPAATISHACTVLAELFIGLGANVRWNGPFNAALNEEGLARLIRVHVTKISPHTFHPLMVVNEIQYGIRRTS